MNYCRNKNHFLSLQGGDEASAKETTSQSMLVARTGSRRRMPTLCYGILLVMTVSLSATAKEIKIGLHDSLNRIYISANQGFQIIDKKSQATILEKKSEDIVLFRSAPQTANYLVIASAPDLLSSSSELEISCKENSNSKEPCIIQIKKFQNDTNKFDKFRGKILITPRKEDFTVINQIDIEDYLKGVIPSEMQASWPLEALKAQAVAARTYTLAKLGRRRNLGYDLKATVEDQMYQGYNKEDSRTNKAIAETKGKFLIDKQGNLVDAYYSANSGLFSSMPENTWQISPKHYLIATKEPSQDKYKWQMKLSPKGLEQKLADLNFSQINGLTVLERSPEGRVRRIIITGHKNNQIKHHTLSGEEFRHHLGLSSTYFTIDKLGSSLVLNGSGYGHGIGMSQYGAKALAENGKNFEEILGYFYKKAKLAEIKN